MNTVIHDSRGRSFVAGLVTVVIPARNASGWIREALDSVQAQTHRTLEVIVVDDGSTDETAALAQSFSGVLDLEVIKESGRGPAAARNRALDKARGEFVQFLDADDLIEPQKIERQVTFARTSGADVVWGGFQRAHDDGHGLALARRVDVWPSIGEDTAADLISATGFVQLGALLVRRSGPLGNVRMPEHMRVIEDVRYQLALVDAGARYAQQPGLSGFVMREHESPHRASVASDVAFWRAVVDNAKDRESTWRAAGSLTDRRARILASIYVYAARQLAAIAPESSREASERARRVHPRYYDFIAPRLRMLARVFGLHRVERVAAVGRAARTALQGRR